MTDDYTPLTDNSVEARLLDIEARCAATGWAYYYAVLDTPDCDEDCCYPEVVITGADPLLSDADVALIHDAPGDIAWLVALVRRYRAALETAVVVIADGWPSTETAVHGHSRAETCLACDLSEALEAEAGLERDKPRCSGA